MRLMHSGCQSYSISMIAKVRTRLSLLAQELCVGRALVRVGTWGQVRKLQPGHASDERWLTSKNSKKHPPSIVEYDDQFEYSTEANGQAFYSPLPPSTNLQTTLQLLK